MEIRMGGPRYEGVNIEVSSFEKCLPGTIVNPMPKSDIKFIDSTGGIYHGGTLVGYYWGKLNVDDS